MQKEIQEESKSDPEMSAELDLNNTYEDEIGSFKEVTAPFGPEKEMKLTNNRTIA